MFVSEAYAMASSGAQQGGGEAAAMPQIFMLLAMFAIFYLLLIRPQQKRAKQHRELVEALKAGDEVVTAGGIHAKVVALQDQIVTVEIATGVKVKVNRSSIASTKSSQEG
jgi:preprotein translocase subunit YajC